MDATSWTKHITDEAELAGARVSPEAAAQSCAPKKTYKAGCLR